MGHHLTPAEIQKHVRVYLTVFAALAALTVITVAVFYLHLPIGQAVVVALLVATVKGSLVACYFMHLISERGLVCWVLGLCAFFFLALLLLPMITVAESVGVH
jgi:cytochrome c oxidase subunit 4